MANKNEALTRINLYKTMGDLKNAESGVGILKQKRDGLIQRMRPEVRAAVQYSQEEPGLFVDAYRKLSAAILLAGRTGVEAAALGVPKNGGVEIQVNHVLGVTVPVVGRVHIPRGLPSYSPGSDTIAIDAARRAFEDLLSRVPQMVERLGVERMAKAVISTNRRVNAMENVCIPELQATVTRINDALSLDEQESLVRQMFFKRHQGSKHTILSGN